MKTRKELANEAIISADPRLDIRGLYIQGFDAGFARAVEMLRSDDAVAARYAANFKVLAGEDAMQPPAKFFADWLEKQSP